MANGILDQLAAASKSNNSGRGRTAPEDRPQAQVWLNIGYTVEKADGTSTFINIPVGVPLDTAELKRVPKSDGEYAQIVHSGNELLKELQALGDKLEPGEAKVVHLEVEVRRTKDNVEIDADSNIFSLKNAGRRLVD